MEAKVDGIRMTVKVHGIKARVMETEGSCFLRPAKLGWDRNNFYQRVTG